MKMLKNLRVILVVGGTLTFVGVGVVSLAATQGNYAGRTPEALEFQLQVATERTVISFWREPDKVVEQQADTEVTIKLPAEFAQLVEENGGPPLLHYALVFEGSRRVTNCTWDNGDYWCTNN